MSKSRTITGFGVTSITLSATGASTWVPFGPFWGQNITGYSSFVDAATSQAVSLEGTLVTTTTSTAAWQTILDFGDLTTAAGIVSFGPKQSTYAAASLNYRYVRAISTELSTATGDAVTVYFAANAGGQ